MVYCCKYYLIIPKAAIGVLPRTRPKPGTAKMGDTIVTWRDLERNSQVKVPKGK
jgi:hypothetical protein